VRDAEVQVLQVLPVQQVPGPAAEPGQLFARMTRVREVPTG
jgi:hypothetical protein